MGQSSYVSKITGQTEYLPVAIGIMGPRGSDSALADFIDDFLQSIGMGEGVSTGSLAYPDLVGSKNDSFPRAQSVLASALVW